jgi:hypothetical protein
MNIYTIILNINKTTLNHVMSTSVSEAATHLKKLSTHPDRCLFAYIDKEQPACNEKHPYIVLKADGTITLQEVSGVTQKGTTYGDDGIIFVGITLKYVSSSINVNEVFAALEKSELVTNLRVAMADGKFAPIIQPSSK